MDEIKKAERPSDDKSKIKKKKSKEEKVVRKIDLLPEKHKEFLLNYFLLGMNGRKAYMKTYQKTNAASAEVLASKLLSNIKVSEAKQEYLQEQWKKKEQAISNLYDKLIRTASADISDYIDESGDVKVSEFNDMDTYPIAHYEQAISDTAYGRNIKRVIKLKDSQKAIDTLGKVLGMIKEPEPVAVEITIRPAEKPEE
jgi:alkyl hydroperoxide reductase subunit AhpC